MSVDLFGLFSNPSKEAGLVSLAPFIAEETEAHICS